MAATKAARLLPVVKETDCYVLFRHAGDARLAHLAQWSIRHGMTSGHSVAHAELFRRVIVIGQPDGLEISDRCSAVFINPEVANNLFLLDPAPESFFLEECS